ncbi:coniferyl aldehyde dehydrogenase [Thalassotalea atypica]|uniref:coniferyl aldehyde dehydrogenase n=1 Tax=Thalassotalea atypica TaxID=2054316 RepID=UPI0025722294|nr:coniferyl aldehyde dehydrogenase [Thalassotalea atypica]
MADNTYTKQEDEQYIALIDEVFVSQKKAFSRQPYPEVDARIADLTNLKTSIIAHKEELLVALSNDFRCRAHGDTKMGDIMPTLGSISYTIKHLKKWMKPSKRHVGIMFQPAKAFVTYQPLGVIGIITPWNYPVFLSLGPLITAIAAGNRAMIKMSEFTPKTNDVIEKIIARVFSKEQVLVVHGGPDVATHFSNQAFDHLLFTGSTRVGKLVMAAASKNLTPVTLELGGKSPTIIDDEIELKDAVSRIILGKSLNAGQTCVAPDYILCPHNRIDALVDELNSWFNQLYPNIANNDDYTAIVNDGQFNRLTSWLEDARTKGALITPLIKGNANDEQTLNSCAEQGKIPLTVLTNVSDEMIVMQDEIFGPLLPIVGYEQMSEAITYVNERPRPLALYLLSHNEQLQQQVLKQTHSGGVCLNDSAMHVAQEDLPFGGVGPSGMGHYHGHEGFTTFSKAKGVYKKGRFNMATNAFPPYGKFIHKMIDKLFLS